ncbi:MAG: hypothetical protein IPJ21_13145 [Sterolibacteriaceae bacterium]|nr:hypothetical protein [Sterolibacteriaceae bacterium]MBK9084740.1 hypothetical protein [Sterolibacteriaceae bacterium]
MKLIFGLVGILLMLLFLGAVFIKLKIVALGVVMAIGIAMMAYDTWLSLGE